LSSFAWRRRQQQPKPLLEADWRARSEAHGETRRLIGIAGYHTSGGALAGPQNGQYAATSSQRERVPAVRHQLNDQIVGDTFACGDGFNGEIQHALIGWRTDVANTRAARNGDVAVFLRRRRARQSATGRVEIPDQHELIETQV
jgi:hypothetical protein